MSEERQSLDTKNPWWGEHEFRYEFVKSRLKTEDSIVDIACGNGFGSYELAKTTNGMVKGIDLSAAAIKDCSDNWKLPNLQFEVDDGCDLQIEDNSLDVIVSFETIEHTTKFKEMLSEFNRILKPDGTIYISTPNRLINSPSGVVTNPFHTQEWTYTELKQILEAAFGEVKLYGQAFTRYKKSKGLSSFFESILYLRGVRKLPLSIKNRIMRLLGQSQLFPDTDDFEMIEVHNDNCTSKTFFAICKKG